MNKLSFAAGLVASSFLLTGVVSHSAFAQAAAKEDVLLSAMKAELAREQKLLVLPGMQKPYFVEYRMDDVSNFEAVANYGALTREESGHQRVVRVTVRVGDFAADSSSSRGDGAGT